MATRVGVIAWCALLSACASAGGGGSAEARSVPIYEGASAVPCSFEVIRRVEGETTVPFVSSRDVYERERDRILGREGARLGASAVIVPDPTIAVGTQVAIPANQVPSTRTIRFAGDAVRFADGCTVGR